MSKPCENCGSNFRVCINCDLYNGKYIEIPNNATNGDIIEKIFNTTSTQFCELARMDNIDNGLCCSLDWWNSPYK